MTQTLIIIYYIGQILIIYDLLIKINGQLKSCFLRNFNKFQ